jgi:hypothetical protein
MPSLAAPAASASPWASSEIARNADIFEQQIRGPVEAYAFAEEAVDAYVVPVAIMTTGAAIAGYGTAVVVSSTVPAAASIVAAGAFSALGCGLVFVGADMGATNINAAFGTSLPTTGLFPAFAPRFR